jgi:hypothetical protein
VRDTLKDVACPSVFARRGRSGETSHKPTSEARRRQASLCGRPRSRYSYLRATIGSISAARRAGR